MNINYNVTSKERKGLVSAIAKLMGMEDEVKYLGTPSYAYQIGSEITVDKNGTMIIPNLPKDILEQLLADLASLGYQPEEAKNSTDAPEHEETKCGNTEHEGDEVAPDDSEAEHEESRSEKNADTEEDPNAPTRITVSIKNDLTGDEEERLFAIVASKHTLLTKALETHDLPIEVDKDVIRFPWFTDHAIDGEAEAYLQLISAIVKMAKEQKRVTAKDKQEENEKFAMRIFLVRLGLKGPDYKLVRKLMSRNLSGNSSWKNGKPEKADENKGDENGATTENHKEVE